MIFLRDLFTRMVQAKNPDMAIQDTKPQAQILGSSQGNLDPEN